LLDILTGEPEYRQTVSSGSTAHAERVTSELNQSGIAPYGHPLQVFDSQLWDELLSHVLQLSHVGSVLHPTISIDNNINFFILVLD
jgi:hypothetical protein